MLQTICIIQYNYLLFNLLYSERCNIHLHRKRKIYNFAQKINIVSRPNWKTEAKAEKLYEYAIVNIFKMKKAKLILKSSDSIVGSVLCYPCQLEGNFTMVVFYQLTHWSYMKAICQIFDRLESNITQQYFSTIIFFPQNMKFPILEYY
jgi:hypothetical protein